MLLIYGRQKVPSVVGMTEQQETDRSPDKGGTLALRSAHFNSRSNACRKVQRKESEGEDSREAALVTEDALHVHRKVLFLETAPKISPTQTLKMKQVGIRCFLR